MIDKESRIQWKNHVQNYKFHLVTLSTFLDKLYYLVRQGIDGNSFTDEGLCSINLVRKAYAYSLEDFHKLFGWFGFKGTSLCSKQVELILLLIPIASKNKLNYMLLFPMSPSNQIEPRCRWNGLSPLPIWVKLNTDGVGILSWLVVVGSFLG